MSFTVRFTVAVVARLPASVATTVSVVWPAKFSATSNSKPFSAALMATTGPAIVIAASASPSPSVNVRPATVASVSFPLPTESRTVSVVSSTSATATAFAPKTRPANEGSVCAAGTVTTGASFTATTTTCTGTAVADASAPSQAFTVNAASVPFAFAAGVHPRLSPVLTVVLPAVTATPPLVSVPVLTASIRKAKPLLSTSASSAAAARAAWVIVNAVSSVAPVSVLTVARVGASFTAVSVIWLETTGPLWPFEIRMLRTSPSKPSPLL